MSLTIGRDLKEDPHGAFAERDADAAELSVDHGYYHAADTVTIFGSGFTTNADITDHDFGSRGTLRRTHAERHLGRARRIPGQFRRRSRRQP